MKITANMIGKCLLICVCLYWSYQLLSSSSPWIFLDNVNLLIHEAGHLLFRPFGEFLTILGGSLFQIVFPLSFFIYFFNRKEFFSSFFILFWVADNIINVSVYMKDAQTMALPLLGGDSSIHDWNWLFSNMGLLEQSRSIGTCAWWGGCVLITTAILGMITTLFMLTKNTN